MTKMVEVQHKDSKTSIKIVAADLSQFEKRGYKTVDDKKKAPKPKKDEGPKTTEEAKEA